MYISIIFHVYKNADYWIGDNVRGETPTIRAIDNSSNIPGALMSI